MKLNATTIARQACKLQVRQAGELNITQMRDAQSAVFEAIVEHLACYVINDGDIVDFVIAQGQKARKRRAHEAMAAKRDTIIKMHLLTPPEKIKAKRRK